MKNTAEQLRLDIVSSAGNAQAMHGTVDGYSDIKIKDSKVIDTSSSADAFSGQSAGDVIKMYGWNEAENNRIFVIVEKESSGEWIKVDKELKDETAPSSAGASIETGSEDLTVTGVSTSDAIADLVNFNTASSSAESVVGRDYLRITAANTVTSFYVADSGDSLLVAWCDLSEG